MKVFKCKRQKLKYFLAFNFQLSLFHKLNEYIRITTSNCGSRSFEKTQKVRSPRNNLMLSLKKNDLELNFYSFLEPFSISCGGSSNRKKILYWDGQGILTVL